MDQLASQLTSQLTGQLASELASDLTSQLSAQLASLSTNISTNISTNLLPTAATLFDNLTTEGKNYLTSMADYLYSSYFVEPPAKPARASRHCEEEQWPPIDDNFTAILSDSELLNVLKMTTKKVMTDVDKYEANLRSMINELTKGNADHFDVMIEFQPLKSHDRMLLLKNSWSSNLLLDSLYQRIHKLPDQMTLDDGGQFNLLTLALFGNDDLLTERELEDLQDKLVKLKFDYMDYVCTKFLLLLDLDLTRLKNRKLNQWQHVRESYEQVVQVFGDYTTENYCHVPDKFDRLLHEIVPEIKSMALKKLEKHLVQRHANGHSIPPVILELLEGKNNLDKHCEAVRRPF